MAIFQYLGGFDFSVIVKVDFMNRIKEDEEGTQAESVAIGYFQGKQPIFYLPKSAPEYMRIYLRMTHADLTLTSKTYTRKAIL